MSNSDYVESLCQAMDMLAKRGAVFVGQSVLAGGTAMSRTFRDVPQNQLIEVPVFENVQLGMCTGISLAGGLPVSCYPRINFLLEGISQLVQHLDKIPLYSDGGYKPKVIIRTAIPTAIPLNPGEQHVDFGYVDAIRRMLTTVTIEVIHDAPQVMPAYQRALNRDLSTVLVEMTERYDT